MSRSALRADSLLHDVVLCFDNGASFGAHRCVLALHSPVFRSMFDPSSPLCATSQRIALAGKDAEEFDFLLEYCYSCDATLVTDQTATSLLMLAEEYQVLQLKKLCEDWLITRCGAESCVDCLSLAQAYRCDELERVLWWDSNPMTRPRFC